MTQEENAKKDKVLYVVFATLSPFLLAALLYILYLQFVIPVKNVLTTEEKVQYQEKFEKELEPLAATDGFRRQFLEKNPEELVRYMHMTDVLCGTNLCNGVDQDQLIMQLKADPQLTKSFSEKYFTYLDEKYN